MNFAAPYGAASCAHRLLLREDEFMSEARSLLRADQVQPQLEILQGLHAGVRLDLEDGEYSVGPTPNADIVLRDKGVLPKHALLRIASGVVHVEATGGDIMVGTLKVAAGQGCRLRLPAEITIGEASLRLSRAGDTEHTLFGKVASAAKGLSARPMEVAGGVLVCAIAVTLASHAVQQAPAEGERPEYAVSSDEARAALMEDGTAAKASRTALAASAVQQAASELDGRLRAAGIQSVRVSAEDQHVTAQGRLSDGQTSKWAAIQRWFDETYGSQVVLASNVAVGALTGGPLLRLQSVWYGDRPYIIADNGTHYYEGGVLDSGWVVQRISDERVLLGKDNETFALTYR
jgi:hypothetical protein